MVVNLKEVKIKQIDNEIFVFVKSGYRHSCYVANRELYETIDISYNLQTIKAIVFVCGWDYLLKVTIPNCNILYNLSTKNNKEIVDAIKDSLDLENMKEWGNYIWN